MARARWQSAGPLMTRIIFHLIVALLSVEYVVFTSGLTVFRLMVLPLSLCGVLLSLRYRISEKQIRLLLLPLTACAGMLFTAGLSGDVAAFGSTLGLLVFLFYVFLFLSKHRIGSGLVFVFAIYSLPHHFALIGHSLGVYGDAFMYHGLTPRFVGLHSDPNFAALYVSVAISAKVWFLVNSKGFLKRGCLVALIAADLFLLALTASRGGAVAMMFAMALIFVFRYGLFRTAILSCLLLLIGIVGLTTLVGASDVGYIKGSLPIVERFKEVDFEEGGGTENIRLSLWERAINDIWARGMLTGYTRAEFIQRNGNYPHNTWLDLGLELGGVIALSFSVGVMLAAGGLIRAAMRADWVAQTVLVLVVPVLASLTFLSGFGFKIFWLDVVLILVMYGRGREVVNAPEEVRLA